MTNNEDNLKRSRFLESERLFLTPAAIEDHEKLFHSENDRETLYLGGSGIQPVTYEASKKRFEERLTGKNYQSYTIILNNTGEYIGYATVHSIYESDRACEWGMVLDSQYRGKGYALEVGKLMLGYLFRDMGIHKVNSSSHSKNTASLKLQESLGFVKEGVVREVLYRRGEYLDGCHYGMLQSEFVKLYGDD